MYKDLEHYIEPFGIQYFHLDWIEKSCMTTTHVFAVCPTDLSWTGLGWIGVVLHFIFLAEKCLTKRTIFFQKWFCFKRWKQIIFLFLDLDLIILHISENSSSPCKDRVVKHLEENNFVHSLTRYSFGNSLQQRWILTTFDSYWAWQWYCLFSIFCINLVRNMINPSYYHF